MKKKTQNAAAVTVTRRLDVEDAIDMSKHDKSTLWSQSISDKKKPATKK